MEYGVLLTLHLLCAITFIGVVLFEVLFLENLRRHLPADLMALVETGIQQRARRFMPYVVGLLFVTGLGLLIRMYWHGWYPPFSSVFSTLLSLKIVLALSVLAQFVVALRTSACGNMTSRLAQATHYSVLLHMLLIVLLAKGMFYLS